MGFASAWRDSNVGSLYKRLESGSHYILHIRCANPSYTSDELVHQLKTTGALLIISHANSLDIALSAARQCGIPADHIVTVERTSNEIESESARAIPYVCLEDLIKEGLSKPASFEEYRLAPGEGKTKLAFLSFSSGTTGRPKARCADRYFTVYIKLTRHSNRRLLFHITLC